MNAPMREPTRGSSRALLRQIRAAINARFNLLDDKADDDVIDAGLRAAVVMRGSHLWVLMFAILIASVGLNVNSAAVVIGAMLISPLMGPIIGIGYGLGIYDFDLIKQSLRNVAIAALIALLTSAVYFLASPLTQPGSELLARTKPTLWDVLIALFGGFAGIIGVTRREKSNVIPGVAIATALMPPLCTAGYGLATRNAHFFLGAVYLFIINSVFIAFSTVVVIRLFNIPHKRFVDERTSRRVHRYLGAVIVLTVTPSLYLAYLLVQEEVFKARAAEFVRRELSMQQTHIAELSIDAKAHRIDVTLIGENVPKDKLKDIRGRLGGEGLSGAELVVHQPDDPHLDVSSLKISLLSDLYKDNQASLKERDDTIHELSQQLAALSAGRTRYKDIPQELQTLYPQLSGILVGDAIDWAAAPEGQRIVVLSASAQAPLTVAELGKIEDWLKLRTQAQRVKLAIDAPPPAPPAAKKKSTTRRR